MNVTHIDSRNATAKTSTGQLAQIGRSIRLNNTTILPQDATMLAHGDRRPQLKWMLTDQGLRQVWETFVG
jgi:hypothetical protein